MNPRWKLLLSAGLLSLVGLACWGLLTPWVQRSRQPTPAAQAPPTAANPTTAAASPTPHATPMPATATTAPYPSPTSSPTPPSAAPAPDLPSAWYAPEPLEPGPVALFTLHMVDERRGWATGVSPDTAVARILITDDGGQTWQEVTPPRLPPSDWEPTPQVAFWDADTAWVAYGFLPPEAATEVPHGVWVTHDRGRTWQWATLPAPEDAMPWFTPGFWAVLDAQQAWLLVLLDAGMSHQYTYLVHTQDGGRSWERLADPYSEAATDLMLMGNTGMAFAPDGRYGWVTKEIGPISAAVWAVTPDGGHSWQGRELVPPGLSPDNAFCRTQDPHLWAAGQGAFLARCYDPTAEGERLFVVRVEKDQVAETVAVDAPPAAEAQLSFVDPQEGYLAVQPSDEGGTLIFATHDGGRSWQQVKTVAWQARAFSWLPNGTGWALADNGQEIRLVRTANGGQSWEMLPTPRLREP